MAELKCAAKNCCYNSNEYCCKGDIMVGGSQAEKCHDTCCESFRDESKDSYRSALDHPSKTISIDCEAAKCVYNSNYKCHATNVDIAGTTACKPHDTECATFYTEQ